jgi:hypothetical protein
VKKIEIAQILGGDCSEDGARITLRVETASGMRRDLDVSYFDLDGIVHLLLALAGDAYDRAIASGRVPEVPALMNEPTVAESVRLLADHRAQEGILQLIGRRDANAPLGAIAFRLTLDQCEFLSARCQEVANELRQRQKLS